MFLYLPNLLFCDGLTAVRHRYEHDVFHSIPFICALCKNPLRKELLGIFLVFTLKYYDTEWHCRFSGPGQFGMLFQLGVQFERYQIEPAPLLQLNQTSRRLQQVGPSF